MSRRTTKSSKTEEGIRVKSHVPVAQRLQELEDALLLAGDANTQLTTKLLEIEGALTASSDLLQQKTLDNERLVVKVNELREALLTSNELVLELQEQNKTLSVASEQESQAKDAIIRTLQAQLDMEVKGRADNAATQPSAETILLIEQLRAENVQLSQQVELYASKTSVIEEQISNEWKDRLTTAVSEYELKLAHLAQETAKLFQEKRSLERQLHDRENNVSNTSTPGRRMTATPRSAGRAAETPSSSTTAAHNFSEIERLRDQLESVLDAVSKGSEWSATEITDLRKRAIELENAGRAMRDENEQLKLRHNKEVADLKEQISSLKAITNSMRVVEETVLEFKTSQERSRIELETEKTRIEEEKSRIEGEKSRIKEEKSHLEGEKSRIEGEKNAVEQEKTFVQQGKEAEAAIKRLTQEHAQVVQKMQAQILTLNRQYDEASLAQKHAETALDSWKVEHTAALRRWQNELKEVKMERNLLQTSFATQLSSFAKAFKLALQSVPQGLSTKLSLPQQAADAIAQMDSVICGLNAAHTMQIEQMRTDVMDIVLSLKQQLVELKQVKAALITPIGVASDANKTAREDLLGKLEALDALIFTLQCQLSSIYFPNEELRSKMRASEAQAEATVITMRYHMQEAVARIEASNKAKIDGLEMELRQLKDELAAQILDYEQERLAKESAPRLPDDGYVIMQTTSGQKIFRAARISQWIRQVIRTATATLEREYQSALNKAIAAATSRAAASTAVTGGGSSPLSSAQAEATVFHSAEPSADRASILRTAAACEAYYWNASAHLQRAHQESLDATLALHRVQRLAERVELSAALHALTLSHVPSDMRTDAYWDNGLSIDDLHGGYTRQLNELTAKHQQELAAVKQKAQEELAEAKATNEHLSQRLRQETLTSLDEHRRKIQEECRQEIELMKTSYAKSMSTIVQENSKEDITRIQAMKAAMDQFEEELIHAATERSRAAAECIDLKQRVAEADEHARRLQETLANSQRRVLEAERELQQSRQAAAVAKLEYEKNLAGVNTLLEQERKKVEKLKDAGKFPFSPKDKTRFLQALQEASSTKIADFNQALTVVDKLLAELKQTKTMLREVSVVSQTRHAQLQAAVEHAERLQKEIDQRNISTSPTKEAFTKPFPEVPAPAAALQVDTPKRAASVLPASKRPLTPASPQDTIQQLRARARTHILTGVKRR